MNSRTTCLVACFIGISAHSQTHEILHYVLAPGSTITPVSGATPMATPEPLKGRFEWELYPGPEPMFILALNASTLEFESASYSLSLNTRPVNDVLSSVHTDSTYTVFNEVADLSGFGLSTGRLSSVMPGSYLGTALRPTVLSYPSVMLSPVGGGLFVARLDLIAVLEELLNIAPSFVIGGNVTVLQNSGPQLISPWATEIRPGAPNEAEQTLWFTVATEKPELFSVPPAVSADGTLAFTPARNRKGLAQVTVQLHDSGGTAYGGQDCSAPQTFLIHVLGPMEAVQQLIDSVLEADGSRIKKRPLLVSLEAARSAFSRGNWRAGINQLGAFENKVQILVAPQYPEYAREWIAQAEAIMGMFAGGSEQNRPSALRARPVSAQ